MIPRDSPRNRSMIPSTGGHFAEFKRIASDCRVVLSGEGPDNLMDFQMWPYARDLLRKARMGGICGGNCPFSLGPAVSLAWLARAPPEICRKGCRGTKASRVDCVRLCEPPGLSETVGESTQRSIDSSGAAQSARITGLASLEPVIRICRSGRNEMYGGSALPIPGLEDGELPAEECRLFPGFSRRRCCEKRWLPVCRRSRGSGQRRHWLCIRWWNCFSDQMRHGSIAPACRVRSSATSTRRGSNPSGAKKPRTSLRYDQAALLELLVAVGAESSL